MKEHKKRLKKLEALAMPGEKFGRIEVWEQGEDGLFRSDDHPGQALTREQVSDRATGTGAMPPVKLIAVYRPSERAPEHAMVALPQNGRVAVRVGAEFVSGAYEPEP